MTAPKTAGCARRAWAAGQNAAAPAIAGEEAVQQIQEVVVAEVAAAEEPPVVAVVLTMLLPGTTAKGDVVVMLTAMAVREPMPAMADNVSMLSGVSNPAAILTPITVPALTLRVVLGFALLPVTPILGELAVLLPVYFFIG